MTSKATINPILTQTAYKFMQNSEEYVGFCLFPTFFTAEQAAEYYVFDKENSLNVPKDIRRAPGSSYARSAMKLSDDSFSCKEYGHEEPVDDVEKAKYASALDADNASVERSTGIIMLNHEIRTHKLATSPAVPSATPATKWDAANSDPVADINVAREVIHDATGQDPNTLVISRDVYNVLCEHPKILDKIKHTQRGVITADLLASVFKVSKVKVAGVVTNTANEGQAATISKIWGDDVVLAKTATSTNLKEIAFGRTFAWTKFTGKKGVQVKSYRQEDINSDVHRASQHTDEKITGAECAYRLSDVLS